MSILMPKMSYFDQLLSKNGQKVEKLAIFINGLKQRKVVNPTWPDYRGCI